MYKISELTVADYLTKMSVCDFPGPAAGSAAATAAAMAAALLEMSCDGSLRKSGDNPLLAESIAIGAELHQACLMLADVDMMAYGQVIAAAKNKAGDREAYETAMKGATEPFIQILRHCHSLLDQIEKVIKGSFSRVLGDLVGGAYLAEAAAAASKSGIDVNLRLIHDEAFQNRYQTEANALYRACASLKTEILDQVFSSPQGIHPDAKAVLDFWFDPQNQPFWFQKNEAFDLAIRTNFYDHWVAGCNGLLSDWRDTVAGRLAEIILLDQFSRNLNRDNPKAFAQDGMALVLSQEAIRHPDFNRLPQAWQRFMLMPFMHSEAADIHQVALPLFEALGDPATLEYEIKHQQIIDQFGHFPHRNEILKRESTAAEIEFLKQPGSSF
ncbi:DUF924 family protein [Acetobacterium carbinolicum]|uniref:DUF924 family protein n=1 Tax=Acetobacterium carbinolicum TaxID=52690 RepID=UPI0039C9A0F3